MATSYTSTDKKEKRPPEVVFKTMSCINGIRNGIIEMKSYIYRNYQNLITTLLL